MAYDAKLKALVEPSRSWPPFLRRWSAPRPHRGPTTSTTNQRQATMQLLHRPLGGEIGTAGFHRPDSGDGQRLWNLAPLIPESQPFSVQTVTTGEVEITSNK